MSGIGLFQRQQLYRAVTPSVLECFVNTSGGQRGKFFRRNAQHGLKFRRCYVLCFDIACKPDDEWRNGKSDCLRRGVKKVGQTGKCPFGALTEVQFAHVAHVTECAVRHKYRTADTEAQCQPKHYQKPIRGALRGNNGVAA